jgi:hypothetical protein
MPFRQFQTSEGGKASKVAVIGAAVLGSGGGANIHDHVDDMRGACCADVKRKYRRHALQHHSDKDGCDEDFYKLTAAKEDALNTCKPCSHSDKKPRGRKQNPNKTKDSKGSTKSKKKAKAKRRKEKSKKRQQEQERNKDKHETKVSATSVAMVVGGLVLASRGPGKKKKKKLLRQTSIGRQTT